MKVYREGNSLIVGVYQKNGNITVRIEANTVRFFDRFSNVR